MKTYQQDYSRAQLARILGISRPTLNQYIKAIKKSNIRGFHILEVEGNPPVFWKHDQRLTDYHRWLIEKAIHFSYWRMSKAELTEAMRKLWAEGKLTMSKYEEERKLVLATS